MSQSYYNYQMEGKTKIKNNMRAEKNWKDYAIQIITNYTRLHDRLSL